MNIEALSPPPPAEGSGPTNAILAPIPVGRVPSRGVGLGFERASIETINSKRRSAGVTGFRQIKSLTASVLALGFCALIITGCGKTSAPKTGAEVTVAEMNQAIQMMSTSPSGGPKKIDDLTNFPTFKGRPFSAPPVGKQFIIDPATHQVVIINQ